MWVGDHPNKSRWGNGIGVAEVVKGVLDGTRHETAKLNIICLSHSRSKSSQCSQDTRSWSQLRWRMSFSWINNGVEEEDKREETRGQGKKMEKWRERRGEQKKTKD